MPLFMILQHLDWLPLNEVNDSLALVGMAFICIEILLMAKRDIRALILHIRMIKKKKKLRLRMDYPMADMQCAPYGRMRSGYPNGDTQL